MHLANKVSIDLKIEAWDVLEQRVQHLVLERYCRLLHFVDQFLDVEILEFFHRFLQVCHHVLSEPSLRRLVNYHDAVCFTLRVHSQNLVFNLHFRPVLFFVLHGLLFFLLVFVLLRFL